MTAKTSPKRFKKDTAASSLVTPAPRWVIPAAVLLIIGAGVAAYSNSLQGPFILDDKLHITENEDLRHPLDVWKKIFTAMRPVVTWSLAANYAISGLEVWSYHVFNLSVHLLAALVLFDLVRRTLLVDSLRPAFGKAALGLALATALLWALHPLQTQAVDYTIQRGEVLMGLFYLLTLYCLLRGATAARRRWAWYTVAVVACALGMGSKEVMVTAPILAVLFDRAFLSPSWREALRQRWGLYLGLIATWGLLAVPAQLALASGKENVGAGFGLQTVRPVQYALSQPGVITHYLGLAILPYPLCFDYVWQPAKDAKEIVPSALLIGGLLLATIWAWFRKPELGFLGLWFFLILAPTSSVMPITDLAVEHRMYLPLAALVVLAVILGYQAGVWLAVGLKVAPARTALLPAIVAGGAVVLLGLLTYQRNEDYRTVASIWEDTTRKSPQNARAFGNLGWALVEQGDYPQALKTFERGIQANPRHHINYFNRGLAYHQMLEQLPNKTLENPEFAKLAQAALQDFSRTLELQPDHIKARYQRGVVQGRLKLHEKAAADLTLVIEKMPNLVEAYQYRAVCYFNLGDYGRAWEDVRKCRQLGVEPDAQIIEKLTQLTGRKE